MKIGGATGSTYIIWSVRVGKLSGQTIKIKYT